MSDEVAHESHGNRLYLTVWAGLLVLTVVEVVLAYLALSVTTMLVTLLGLSIFKAALIMAYFMHLRFERVSLTLTLIPMLILCIFLIVVFFMPDSMRLLEMRGS